MSTTTDAKTFIEEFTDITGQRKLFLGDELSDDERVLIVKNATHLNGKLSPKLKEFLGGFNPQARATTRREIMELIAKEGIKETPPPQPKPEPVATKVTKKESREQRMIVRSMQAELYRMMGISGKSYENIQDEIKKHRSKELQDYKKLIFAAVEGDADEIDALSLIESFAPLFGTSVITKKVPKQTMAAVLLLSTRYQKSLFQSSEEMTEVQIHDAFKEKVLTATARGLVELSGGSVEEEVQQLEPEYAGAEQELKRLILGEE